MLITARVDVRTSNHSPLATRPYSASTLSPLLPVKSERASITDTGTSVHKLTLDDSFWCTAPSGLGGAENTRAEMTSDDVLPQAPTA